MKKIVTTFLMMTSLVVASDYDRAVNVADKAFKGLDCEFEECPKEQPKPKVIVKEKIVEKPVEKVVYKEKVVYRDRSEIQKETIEKKPVTKQVAVAGVKFQKAFFDVYPPSQAPILDYITFDSRRSFDIEQFVDTVNKIKEKHANVEIYGRIKVPETITTPEVYIYNGENYKVSRCCWGSKDIFYNGSKTAQNSDYLIVKVRKDKEGTRYIDYKIKIHLDYPWKVKAFERDLAPNTFHFKVAPKVRGYKNKFVPAKVFIFEE